ncbi:MAG: HD domain-containing protein [Bryobacterales bacterium]
MTDRFDQALSYASRLHRGQRRKGADIPYVAHLLAVASLVLEHGGDEEEAIAALLHDSIEDIGGASLRREIREHFGERVLSIVEGCTDSDTNPKPPWKERKKAHVESLASADASVRLVIAADKLHNVRSLLMDHKRLGDRLWQRFRGGRDGTLWYYRAVTDALLKTEVTPLVEELQRAVTELEAAVTGPAAS